MRIAVAHLNNTEIDTDVTWAIWRANVVAAIRSEYSELFPDLHQEEIDWDAWRPLYEEGHSAQAAVALAMSGGLN
ncbi:MAG: hypothetical protein ABUL52_00735 [Solimonas sp.]